MVIKQVFIALDQLANTLLGGYADETLSARAWRRRLFNKRWMVMQRVIDALFFDPSHCQRSYEAEKTRAQLPSEYQKFF